MAKNFPRGWTWKDEVMRWLLIVGLVVPVVLFVAALLAVMVDMVGYGLGLWHVACALDSSQPHCVTGGWGHHIDAVIRGNR